MRPIEGFLVLAIVMLLAVAAFQYQETLVMQSQINNLQAAVQGIPNESNQIYQLQQQINNLEARLPSTTTTQSSSFAIVALCIDVSQTCPNTTRGFVFALSIRNTGVLASPAGGDNTVSLKGQLNGSNSAAFARVFNISVSAIPPGGLTTVGLTSWQGAFGSTSPPFSKGTIIGVWVCLWNTQTCQGKNVKAGG
jgi:Tfp pilus assembly protein PilE